RYVGAIQSQANISFRKTGVLHVSRSANDVLVETTQGSERFDWVVFASHADDSLKLLKDPSAQELDVLSKFRYQDNRMVVHSDTRIMPKSRRQWASWHVHVTPSQATE